MLSSFQGCVSGTRAIVRLMVAGVLALAGVVAGEAEPAGIPVRFTLDKPSVVTLVIDDASGRRVRNLLADTRFEAGEHVVYWDGRDESGGVKEYPDGVFRTDGQPVPPGTYHVRGLAHDGIELIYEFSVYTAGHPAWGTPSGTGRWMADHTPPIDALYLPPRGGRPAQMLLGSFVAEAGDALVWTDLNGRKLAGVRWVGGNWTGALALARDEGRAADPTVDAYAISSWLVQGSGGNRGERSRRIELRVSALAGTKSRQVWLDSFDPTPFESQGPLAIGQVRASEKRYVSDAAVRDRLIVLGLVRHGELRFVDAAAGKAVGTYTLPDVRGVEFDAQGRLLAVAGQQVRRYNVQRTDAGVTLAGEQVVIAEGLLNPNRITIDHRNGQLYISDWGDHTVKVFAADGKFLRSIGTPGPLPVGRYDPTRMNNPSGMALLPDGSLWVAEENYAPKRVSVWARNGSFVKAFYGPPQYGGGGNLSADKKTFYYFDNRGMAFDLDWETGRWSLRSIYYDPEADTIGLYTPRVPGERSALGLDGGPQTPIEFEGRRYLTNVQSGSETSQPSLLGLWLERGDVAVPVAVVGDATQWPLMRQEPFRSRLPAGVDLEKYVPGRSPVLVAWSDANEDGQVQVEEVTSRVLENFGSKTTGVYRVGRLTFGADLSVTTTFTYHLKPRRLTAGGVPLYDVADAVARFQGPIDLSFAVGHDVVPARDGFVVLAGSPVRGFKDGQLVWTYPNAWASLHTGHQAPPRQYPGQLIATTKVLGLPVKPRDGEAGEIWAYNGDRGNVYLMTTDGLFVADLFRTPTVDQPRVQRWATETARRGMRVTDFSVPGENFLPTINQGDDGEIYLVTGKEHCSLVRVAGLETIRRLPEVTLQVDVIAAGGQDRPAVAAAAKDVLRVGRRDGAIRIDGRLDEWADAEWAQLDANTHAALCVAGDQLVVAYRTREKGLLNNRPESLHMLFKTGGALDLMLRTDARANQDRGEVIAGDIRLLVTEVEGKPVAVLYRPIVAGAAKAGAEPVQFSSPWRTISFDRVDDVSKSVRLAHADGNYEYAIPLAVLGLQRPQANQRLRGDVGVLRGDAGQTTQRLYWHNRNTGVVEDVPSEAALSPKDWGSLVFD